MLRRPIKSPSWMLFRRTGKLPCTCPRMRTHLVRSLLKACPLVCSLLPIAYLPVLVHHIDAIRSSQDRYSLSSGTCLSACHSNLSASSSPIFYTLPMPHVSEAGVLLHCPFFHLLLTVAQCRPRRHPHPVRLRPSLSRRQLGLPGSSRR
jgi:hypothetical protein